MCVTKHKGQALTPSPCKGRSFPFTHCSGLFVGQEEMGMCMAKCRRMVRALPGSWVGARRQ